MMNAPLRVGLKALAVVAAICCTVSASSAVAAEQGASRTSEPPVKNNSFASSSHDPTSDVDNRSSVDDASESAVKAADDSEHNVTADVCSKSNSSSNNNRNYKLVDDDDPLLTELFQWVDDDEDAFISESIQLRRDPVSMMRGIYATQDITEGEILITIPWHLTIDAEQPKTETEMEKYAQDVAKEIGKDFATMDPEAVDEYFNTCETVRLIHLALTADDADLTPYARFLSAQSQRTLPTLWSRAGRDLLHMIIPSSLPPMYHVDSQLVREFWDDCRQFLDLPDFKSVQATYLDGGTPVGVQDERVNEFIHAWMIAKTRADDDVVMPIYDMFNHRNGPDLNTLRFVYSEATSFSLLTTKDVKAGGQLYNSYNQCDTCGGREHDFGTPEIFRDYGFVEDYPRRFIIQEFDVARIKMDIDINKEESTRSDGLKATFLVPLSPDAIDFMEWHQNKLQQKLDIKQSLQDSTIGIPQHEWDSAWKLLDAFLTAFTVALEDAKSEELSDEVWEMGDAWYMPNWEALMDDEDDDGDDDDQDDDDDEGDDQDDNELSDFADAT